MSTDDRRELSGHAPEGDAEEYEPPEVEEIDTTHGPAATAAGVAGSIPTQAPRDL